MKRAVAFYTLYLDVARAVDDLVAAVGESGVTLGQHALHPDHKGPLKLYVLNNKSIITMHCSRSNSK